MKSVAELISSGRHDEALRECASRLQADNHDHAAHFWRGIVLAERNEILEATHSIEQAIALHDQSADYHAHLGRCLIRLQRPADALASADRALALNPADPLTLDTLGVIYSFCGFHLKAAEVLQLAVAAAPKVASYWFNLGASLKFNGDIAGAEQAYEQALQIKPDMDKALAALSHLRRKTTENNNIPRLQKHLTNFKGELQDEMRVSFALAKEYDDTSAYAAGFRLINDVSKRWRQRIRYSIDDDARMFDALHEGFDKTSIQSAGAGHNSAEPVFIIGMPRSGTTLTERILSSHSDVFAAGELNKFGMLVRIAAQARSNPAFDPAKVRQVLASDLAKLGQDYVASTRPATGHTPHFIDKMPLNFLYAGFILSSLPQAKIICVRRNPMDTCLGNFRQLFSLRSAYYAYSYDVLDCGRYYLMFDRLMKHWDALFPGRILTVAYEDIVLQQEAKSREIVNYCGLDWEDSCLTFDSNPAPVATASSAQVREPIYTRAMAHWKNYAVELEPLVEFFAQNGVEI